MILLQIKSCLSAESICTEEGIEVERERKSRDRRKTRETDDQRLRNMEGERGEKREKKKESRALKPCEDRHDVTSSFLCSRPHRKTLTWVQSAPFPPQSKQHSAWSCSMPNIATTYISDVSSDTSSTVWEIGRRMQSLLLFIRSVAKMEGCKARFTV